MSEINFQGQKLILYGTSACHLCELAEQLLQHYRQNVRQISYCIADISESDELFERYGVRIPVLLYEGNGELDWPFSLVDLKRFLGPGSRP